MPSTDPYSRHRKSALDNSFPGGVFLIPGSSRRGTIISDIMPGEERPLTVRHLGRGYRVENVKAYGAYLLERPSA